MARRGWKVLDRNYRDGPRELDLVVERDGVLAFVEVKFRSGPGCAEAFEAITARKRRDLELAARAWIREHGLDARKVRFDAVSVVRDPEGEDRVHHLPDAWWPGW